MRRGALFLFFTALLVRLLPLLWATECFDVTLYRYQALPIFEKINPYAFSTNAEFSNVVRPFTYLPLSLFYGAGLLGLSEAIGWPFHLMVRLASILFDLGLLAFLYRILSPAAGSRIHPAWIYALSPIPILTASFQGNIMAGPVLLCLASVVFYKKHRNFSALLLGLAIAWRTFPILLLPLFLTKLPNRRQQLSFLLWALFPGLVSALPFLVYSPALLLDSLRYSGMDGILGWHAILDPAGFFQAVHWSAASASAFGFVLFFGFYVYLLKKSGQRSLAISITALFLSFYFLSTRSASQYFLWALPFLLLCSPKMAIIYSVVGGIAILLKMLQLYPEIVLGVFHPANTPAAGPPPFTTPAALFFWLLCGGILFWLVKKKDPMNSPAEELSIGPSAEKIISRGILAFTLLVTCAEIPFLIDLPSNLPWKSGREFKIKAPAVRQDPPLVRAVRWTSGRFAWHERGTSEIILLEADGRNLGSFHIPQDGRRTVSVFDMQAGEDARGEWLLVSDYRSGFLGRFDTQGRKLETSEEFSAKAPAHLAVDSVSHRVAVLDLSGPSILLFDAQDALLRRIPFPLTENPIPLDCYALAFSAEGSLYLLDGPAGRIRRLDADRSDGPQTEIPKGLLRFGIDSQGKFYALGALKPRIYRYTTKGRLEGVLDNPPAPGLRALETPTDLAIAADGALWIADAWRSKLSEIVPASSVNDVHQIPHRHKNSGSQK